MITVITTQIHMATMKRALTAGIGKEQEATETTITIVTVVAVEETTLIKGCVKYSLDLL